MARKIDPIIEVKRAMKQVLNAKKHIDQLPEELRQAIFDGFPHRRSVTLTLSPCTLDVLLNALIDVEHTHDRLKCLLVRHRRTPRG